MLCGDDVTIQEGNDHDYPCGDPRDADMMLSVHGKHLGSRVPCMSRTFKPGTRATLSMVETT